MACHGHGKKKLNVVDMWNKRNIKNWTEQEGTRHWMIDNVSKYCVTIFKFFTIFLQLMRNKRPSNNKLQPFDVP